MRSRTRKSMSDISLEIVLRQAMGVRSCSGSKSFLRAMVLTFSSKARDGLRFHGVVMVVPLAANAARRHHERSHVRAEHTHLPCRGPQDRHLRQGPERFSQVRVVPL